MSQRREFKLLDVGRMPALFALFVEARTQGTYDRLLKRLANNALLILDDLGLGSLTE